MLLVYDNQNGLQVKLRDSISKRVAYFSASFPKYSESCVYREFIKLLEMEFNVEAISLSQGDPGPIPNEARWLVNSTPAIKQQPLFWKMGAHLRRAIASPFRYWGAFFKQLFDTSLFNRSKFKAMKLFYYGVLLARMLQERKIEHLHVHFADIPASIALTAHRLTGIPYSIASYSKDVFSNNPDLKMKLRKASWITTISSYHKQHLLDQDPFLEAAKIEVVPPGVDLSLYTPEKDEKDVLQKPRVISISKLVENSGIEQLLTTYKLLAAKKLDFEAVIVGDGPEKYRLQQLTNELRLNRHVRFAGALRVEEILELMRTADVFVLPYRSGAENSAEGFPVTIVEAMACGLPVVAPAIDGIDELIDKNTGRIFSPREQSSLPRAIEEILTNIEVRESMAKSARERVILRNNIDETIKSTIGLLYPGARSADTTIINAWISAEEKV